MFPSPLVEAGEVLARFRRTPSKVCFVDAAWYLDPARNAEHEYAARRLPGAIRFNIDQPGLCVPPWKTDLPHMLPDEDTFTAACARLGIPLGDEDVALVCYGGRHCFGPARSWWTLRAFGHDNTYVLQGGLQAWVRAGGVIDTTHKAGAETFTEETYPFSSPRAAAAVPGTDASPSSKRARRAGATLDRAAVVDLQAIAAAQDAGAPLAVLDARPAARFDGTADEPRPGLRRGHMPGSTNVPFTAVYEDGDWSTFKSPAALRQVFADAGVDVASKEPLVCSCGSGVTGAVLSFALAVCAPEHRADPHTRPVYDGSWAEYGKPSTGRPVLTAAAAAKSAA